MSVRLVRALWLGHIIAVFTWLAPTILVSIVVVILVSVVVVVVVCLFIWL